MKKLLSLAAVLLLSLNIPVGYSEEKSPAPVDETPPLFVTAYRTPVAEETIARATSTVGQGDLSLASDLSLTESVRQTPGLRVQQLGGPGAFTSVRLRGLRNFDTQLLVNGLPFRDAAEPQGSANGFYQHFLPVVFGQIETVRGANSTLYGSDSIGGSINLLPLLEEGKPSLETIFEGGTLNTFTHSYTVSGGEPNFLYRAGYARQTSEGIDSHDDYENNTYHAAIEFTPAEQWKAGVNFHGVAARGDTNEAPALRGREVVSVDDPNDYLDTDFLIFGSFVTFQAAENWDHTVRFGAVDTERKFVVRQDADFSDFPGESDFNGNTYNLEYQTNLRLNDQHLITFGYEHEREELTQITPDLGSRIKEEPDQYHNDWYLQDQMNFLDETLFVTLGGRITDHETVGTDVNGEISAAYLIKETGTKVRSHLGTGFRAPSLFELFGATTFGGTRFVFGNEDLDPEQSLSWDVGVDQKVCDGRGELSVTYFIEDIDDVIVFAAAGFANAGGLQSQGIETAFKYEFNDCLTGRAFYTFTDSEGPGGGVAFGVPEHIWGFDIVARVLEKIKVLVRATYNGENDFNVFVPAAFATVRRTAEEYFKVDAVVAYEINPHAEVYVRAENIFDEEIEENGFDGIPAMVFGGVKIKI